MFGHSFEGVREEILQAVEEFKQDHSRWDSPQKLANELGYKVCSGTVGDDFEGCTVGDRIFIGGDHEHQGRRLFTFYHEMGHHILDQNERLISHIHELPAAKAGTIDQVIERLCDVAAGEFLLPRTDVQDIIRNNQFSLDAFKALNNDFSASKTATFVQFILNASHETLGVIVQKSSSKSEENSMLTLMNVDPQNGEPRVVVSISSNQTKYTVGTGALIPEGHFIHHCFDAEYGTINERQEVQIPFKSDTTWKTKTEAIRLGSQVFAVFHLEQPSKPSENQLGLGI